MAEVTRIDVRVENTTTGFSSTDVFLHLIDMPDSMQEELLDEVHALLKHWEEKWSAYTHSQLLPQPQAIDAAKLVVDWEASGGIVRGQFDPKYPSLSSFCEREDHERCDQFGWMPWCQCECHAPLNMTNVCYHGRHDLCPKQPTVESGLARCVCQCHEK